METQIIYFFKDSICKVQTFQILRFERLFEILTNCCSLSSNLFVITYNRNILLFPRIIYLFYQIKLSWTCYSSNKKRNFWQYIILPFIRSLTFPCKWLLYCCNFMLSFIFNRKFCLYYFIPIPIYKQPFANHHANMAADVSRKMFAGVHLVTLATLVNIVSISHI